MLTCKKWLKVSIFTLFLFVTLSFASLALDVYDGQVTTSQLNMRTSASTGSTIVSKLPLNANVIILGESGDFYRISYNFDLGYAHKDYIKIGELCAPSTASVSASGGLNLRSTASTDGASIVKIPNGSEVKVIDLKGAWASIIYGDNIGYCAGQYLSCTAADGSLAPLTETSVEVSSADEPTFMAVRASGGLNLRAEPSSSSERIAVVPNGARVEVISDLGEWIYISYGEHKGYASSSYLVSSAISNRSSGARAEVEDLLNYAKSLLGVKYLYGGTSPTKGFDCSGYVYHVFNKFGYTLPRTASAQKAALSTVVSKENLLPGDLVFFKQGGKAIGHVGIYVGGNQFIHASSPGDYVKYDSLGSSYYSKNYVTARRVIS